MFLEQPARRGKHGGQRHHSQSPQNSDGGKHGLWLCAEQSGSAESGSCGPLSLSFTFTDPQASMSSDAVLDLGEVKFP